MHIESHSSSEALILYYAITHSFAAFFYTARSRPLIPSVCLHVLGATIVYGIFLSCNKIIIADYTYARVLKVTTLFPTVLCNYMSSNTTCSILYFSISAEIFYYIKVRRLPWSVPTADASNFPSSSKLPSANTDQPVTRLL